MTDIIKIKCPFDGAVLSVKNQPGLEKKNVTCPVCKHKYPFTSFRLLTPKSAPDDSGTEYPGTEEHTSYAYGPAAGEMNLTLGKLHLVGSGISFQLRPGRNVIGRKGSKSQADFQIDMGEKRAMSREHIVIVVNKVPGKGFVHYISLFKEKVNKTFIGEDQLLYGDCIVLNHGDMIKLPDATIRFEIPDDEATDI